MTATRHVIFVLTISWLHFAGGIVGGQLAEKDQQVEKAAGETTETWLGTLDVTVAKLRLQLDLKTDSSGKVTGNMLSLDQTTTPIPMDEVVRTGKELKFEIRNLGAKYDGTIDETGKIANGTFTQGQDFALQFKKVDSIPTVEHQMTWVGTLIAGEKEFEFQFRIFVDSEGNHTVKLDSFSEGLMGLPCDLKMEDNQVTIDIKISAAQFVGTLSDDHQTVTGNWLQRGGKFPLTLKQIPLTETRSTKLNRPQTPKPPFPYQVSEFQVAAKDLDAKFDPTVALAGTLTKPPGAGPFTTVILISGSGQQDRDETIFQHKPFAVIADHLTRSGFAVIRFDDRGVGKSAGPVSDATTINFADDVETLFLWAQQQPSIDAKKIILAGHSEGGLIAPIVANRQPDVAGVILLAGPGVPGNQIILNQVRKIAAASGMPDNVLEMQDKFLRDMMAALNSETPPSPETIDQLATAAFGDLSEEQKKEFGIGDIALRTRGTMGSPWMKYFLTYDPVAALASIHCPILSLIGQHDLQVDPALNLPAIEAAVKTGGNSNFEQRELPGLNHLFQTSESGSPSEYIKIEETTSPLLLDEMTNWLKKHFQ